MFRTQTAIQMLYVGETSSFLKTKEIIFGGINQLFMSIASSRDVQWIAAKQKFLSQSNMLKRRIRETIEILLKPSLKRNNDFALAKIS